MSKEKQMDQIKEIGKILEKASRFTCEDVPLLPPDTSYCNGISCYICKEARMLIDAGYRKQSEGEWIVSGMFDDFLKCSSCGYQQPWQTAIEYKYCPNCGAKMKGGAE